jgi:PST family polysaccharide transporter
VEERPVRTSSANPARQGAMWVAASAILLRFSNILVMIVVARVIAPSELGVYALAVTVYGFVSYFAEFGIGAALARADLDIDKLAPTVTTFTILSGWGVAGLTALSAGPLASVLGVPEAAGPIRILALTAAITGTVAAPMAQLQREFRQDVQFRANLIAFVGSTATLLLLTTVFGGAEAFAWSRVAGHLIVAVVVVAALRTRYRPGWSSQFVAPLLRFGVPVALGGVLSQLVLNIDYVIIGRELTRSDLGIYMLAFNICAWPTAILGTIMMEIVLPAFSGVRRDGRDLRDAVARGVRATALVSCPIAAFTWAFAYPLVETLYGDQWLQAADVVKVLALYGIAYVLGLMFANMLVASGRTMGMFTVQAVTLVLLIPALIVGVHLDGLVGVGVGHIVVVLGITLPAYAFGIRRTTGVRFLTMLKALVRPILAAAAAAAVALVATRAIDLPVIKLAVGGCVGLVVYTASAGPALLELLPDRIASFRPIAYTATSLERAVLVLSRKEPVDAERKEPVDAER